MWTYNQSNGELSHDGTLIGTGYSGAGEGKNCPAKDSIHDVGPIPAGDWEICGPPMYTQAHGPFVLRLEPDQITQTHGRVGFLMHGDSILKPGEASQGCIIMPKEIRLKVWESNDRKLRVLSGLPALDPEISV